MSGTDLTGRARIVYVARWGTRPLPAWAGLLVPVRLRVVACVDLEEAQDIAFYGAQRLLEFPCWVQKIVFRDAGDAQRTIVSTWVRRSEALEWEVHHG